jgi:regulator of cell morphogenesis and NO signaling
MDESSTSNGTIDVETTLGDVVTAHPELARELERHGLDYCCGGQRTIAEASRAAGIDAAALVASLAPLTTPRDAPPWATMTVVELVDHIESAHHRYLWDELPRLSALLAKVAGVHGDRHPELRETAEVLAEVRADLEPHLTKEERVLFPAIRALAAAGADGPPTFPFGSVANPISMMVREHDRAGDLLARLRDATDDYRVPDDGCASYHACFEGLAELEADTHLHVHKENNLLFPAVVQLENELAVATAR